MVVFCTYCGQSFTRDEHLERHILTHTNVKPFKCFTCHMSFARRDLLQRHYTVHGKDQNQEPIPATNGIIPKSAGRTPIACSNCAKTKTKCDKKFPCSRCAGRNLTCTLRPTRRTSKNASRMGMIVGPDGTTLMPAPPGMLRPDGTVHPQHLQPASAPPQPQPLRPASPKDKLGPIIEEVSNQIVGSMAPPMSRTSPTALVETSPASPGQFPTLPTEELVHTDESEHDTSSPHFMLDWSQMQMPIGFDGMMPPHMLMQPVMPPFGTGMLNSMIPTPDMLSMIPDMSSNAAPLITPIESPLVERPFSDIDVGGSATMFEASRNVSVTSLHDGKVELSAIIAAQDSWSVFRCTPIVPSSSCPKTAKLNLEKLEQSLKNHKGWSNWSSYWNEGDNAGGEHLTVMQLHESTRDKLLAITQSFLHKALDIHRDHALHPSDDGRLTPVSNSSSNFVLLPPARVLEYFLRSYANCFERHFPLTSKAILDVNELMHCFDDKASSLLVLMMVAQGAMNIPDMDARWLTAGLTEACRISLFDLVERNVIMAGDPIVLHAALLLIGQAAWSGDKWQMDIAIGQRGMYFSMLRHSGILDCRADATPPTPERRSDTEQLWNQWIQNESRSRLVYSWAMVDQDLALFHDSSPNFSITEFNTPMPDTDRLWHAKSATDWSAIFEQVHEFSGGFSSIGSGARPLSLRELFRLFLDDEMISLGIEMTPLQLRLLLHPLQSMVCQLGQLLSCFADPLSLRNQGTRAVSASSTRSRLQEVQTLLSRWFDLAERYLKANSLCAMMQTNLILFHLISLNAVTNFPEIERLARRENVDGTLPQLVWLHQRCVTDVEEAIFHCGQVLRHVRAMPRGIRPQWWPAAIYRIGLVLWTDSLVRNPNIQNVTPPGSMSPARGVTFAVDMLPPDHPLIVRYLTKREGVPRVSKRDGSQISIDQPFQILQHCVDCIDEGAATRLSDGIRLKLDRLSKGWIS